MAKFLVTGGAGFIGSHVVRSLAQRGMEVVILDAMRRYAWPPLDSCRGHDYSYRLSLLNGCRILKQDLTDFNAVAECLLEVRPDAIIHLAANPIVASAEDSPDECRRDVVDAAEVLIEAIRATGGVRRFVHVSSSMVYGDFSNSAPTECRAPNPVNAYGVMKLECEQLVRTELAQAGIPCSIVRPMAAFGPGDFYDRVIPVFCREAAAGRRLTIRASADMRIDFTYVTDVADGIVRAAVTREAEGETFNLSFGEARSLLDVTSILNGHFPALRYDVVEEHGVRRPCRGALDISKARMLLGYRPEVTLEDGIGFYLRHMRERGSLSPPALAVHA